MFDGLPSPFVLRSRGFNPATLFASGAELGFVLDLASDALSTRTPGTGVQTITTAVKGRTFSQGTAGSRPTYQLDGSLPYLQFDGTDDWMSTVSLSLGATDAVTVVAAMRRGQNVNLEDIFGITTTPTAANGSFVLAATSDASTDNMGFSSKGDGANALARAGSSSVGVNYVLTGVGDISADTCLIRRNGSQIGTSANDQGAGNWTAADAYLGARAGSSRFFNGRLYALIVVNRILTAGELAGAEAWAASKCGITL